MCSSDLSAKDGKLYVADQAGTGACSPSCIWRVDPGTGAIDAAPVFVGQGQIEGVAFDATGDNLYYTDRQRRVGRLAWNGTTYATGVLCNDTAQSRPQDPFHLVFDATAGLLMVDDNSQEVVRLAERQAQEILENARNREREIRLGAEDYADEILGTLEANLGKFLGAVQRGRSQLASSSPDRTEGGSAQFTEITT